MIDIAAAIEHDSGDAGSLGFFGNVLADFDRSPTNPAGLLIGQVTETQIHSETKQVMSTGLVDGEEQKQP